MNSYEERNGVIGDKYQLCFNNAFLDIRISTQVESDLNHNKIDIQELLTSLLHLSSELPGDTNRVFFHVDDSLDLILLISFSSDALLVHKAIKNKPRVGLARKCAILRLDKELQKIACKE